MKLTNGDIFAAQEPLKKLIEQKFPVMVSYKLAKMIKKLDEPYKLIEETKQGLIKKYGAVDSTGKLVTRKGDNDVDILDLSPEREREFLEEFNELMNQEVEIVMDKVKLPEKVASTCDKCNHNMDKPFEIEPKIMLALDKFVEA